MLGLDLVAVRLGGSRLRTPDDDPDVALLENSGSNVPLPPSAALMIFRAGRLGAISLCTVGKSATFCLRIGLKLGDSILGDLFMNMEVDVLSELGAGIIGVLCVLATRGRLVALDGAGSTAVVEPPPFNMLVKELPWSAV
jgi:hypothetical protein